MQLSYERPNLALMSSEMWESLSDVPYEVFCKVNQQTRCLEFIIKSPSQSWTRFIGYAINKALTYPHLAYTVGMKGKL